MKRRVRILTTSLALVFAGALALSGCGPDQGREEATSPESGRRPQAGAGSETSGSSGRSQAPAGTGTTVPRTQPQGGAGTP